MSNGVGNTLGGDNMAKKKIDEITDDFWDNIVNETNKKLIEAFLEQQHLSPDTLKQYQSALKIFAKWIYDNHFSKKDNEEKIIPELRPRDAMSYQNWLQEKGLSPNGVKFKRSVVSSLCGFIEVFYDDLYPNFRNIYSKAVPNVAKSNVKEKIPLTKVEIDKLDKELTKREEWQKLAYLWFTYITGCRREESRQLLSEVTKYEIRVVKDKKGKEKKFYVTHRIRAKGRGKEGKVRVFQFDERAMQAIKKWMNYRKEQVPDDNCPYVFVSKSNGNYKQLSKNTFNLWCEGFSKILGGKTVHPHLFRSSRATIAKENGADIKDIQKLLGHESSQTTEIYIIQDDSEDIGNLF